MAASEYSFDVVSTVDLAEVKNALDAAEKEIATRYDLRNTKTKIEQDENTLKILSDDEFRLNIVLEIVRSKLIKRDVSLKSLEYGKIEQASGGAARQTVTLRQGYPDGRSEETGQGTERRRTESAGADSGRSGAHLQQRQRRAANRAGVHQRPERPAV